MNSMMYTLAKVIHILACLALTGIVLMQADKGEGLGGAFGSGGSGALFGKRGASGYFAKLTAGAAVTFMITSFYLGWIAESKAPRMRPGRTVPTNPSN